jgi:DNA-binding SARP family transcriptional activator
VIRIQLCGQFAVVVDGRRVDSMLPGKRGRALVALLAASRADPMDRSAVLETMWPDQPDSAAATLTVLLSKIRPLIGPAEIRGRSQLQLILPADAMIDVETAVKAIHEAQSAVALGQWQRAWAQSLTALFIARRRYLPEFDAPWVQQGQARLELVHHRALACYAEAGLGIGTTELPAAERAARTLIDSAPLSEIGYRLLMRVLIEREETADALAVYDQLRRRLYDELGVQPATATQDLYRRLLGAPDGRSAAASAPVDTPG